MTSLVSDAELRQVYAHWEREEAEAIDVIEAVGRFLAMKAKEEAADPIDFCPLSFGMAQDDQSPMKELQQLGQEFDADQSPADEVERVAKLVEGAIERHGIPVDRIEGTLDDAHDILAAIRNGNEGVGS